MILKYDELEKAPVGAEKILAHRRSEDAAPTLWNVLNVVQENMMEGGQADYNRRRPESRRFFGKSRAVKGLDETSSSTRRSGTWPKPCAPASR